MNSFFRGDWMAAEEGRQQQMEPLAMPVAQSTIDREALVFTSEVRNMSWYAHHVSP